MCFMDGDMNSEKIQIRSPSSGRTKLDTFAAEKNCCTYCWMLKKLDCSGFICPIAGSITLSIRWKNDNGMAISDYSRDSRCSSLIICCFVVFFCNDWSTRPVKVRYSL